MNTFNLVAPAYNLFFRYQTEAFKTILNRAKDYLFVPEGSNVLDIGCGTGALAFCLHNIGYKVVGVDVSSKMINIARQNNRDSYINFILADALKGLPFNDKSFDLVISSFVVHGLDKQSRLKFLTEAGRLAKKQVIIHDFNQKRKWLSDVIEWAEGGNYFHFIKHAEEEMKTIYSNVKVVSFANKVAWYICTPSN